ncbi:MAG TPA: DUF2071 domain-containing protein [Lacunisphaera sp.]|nr:DUF2071 domain-containing protein [Lacunisphaera sp.]
MCNTDNLPPRAAPGSPALTGEIGHAALSRMLSVPNEPLLYADWERTLMIHYEVDPVELAAHVPFPLDLHEGRAFVSLVAFTLRGMRPRRGGWLGKWLMRPIATHGFLNVRTYVRSNGEAGIYFIAEFLNKWLSLKLGPALFGLPYRFARLNYDHDPAAGRIAGLVHEIPGSAAFAYHATLDEDVLMPATAGSLTEWLMERYTAFTVRHGCPLLFRVWHPPWPKAAATVRVTDDSLLRKNLPWFANARLAGAHYSPGVFEVWMGRPHPVGGPLA